MKVHFFFRKQLPGFFSIEEVFNTIISAMEGVECIRKEAPEKRIRPWTIWKNIKWAKKNKGEINHITGDVSYLALGTGSNTIITLHDIGSLLKGNSLSVWLKKQLWLEWPAKKAKAITVISQSSAKEVEKTIPFAKGKIKVVHNPVNPALYKRVQNGLPERPEHSRPKVLVVGTKANKNLNRILEAVVGMELRLVILGKLTKDQISLLNELNIDYQNKFNLSYDQVIDFYRQSSMLCFPSTYEGFGMPIIEAQALGIPVLTSNYGAMKEIAGDSAHLVDPTKVLEIKKGIAKILTDEKYRSDIIKKGKENVKRFEAEKIAAQYKRIYEEILADSR